MLLTQHPPQRTKHLSVDLLRVWHGVPMGQGHVRPSEQMHTTSKNSNGLSSTQLPVEAEALAKEVANARMKPTVCPKTSRL